MTFDCKGEAIAKYQTDPVFHARVQSAVSVVMQIITRNLGPGYEVDATLDGEQVIFKELMPHNARFHRPAPTEARPERKAMKRRSVVQTVVMWCAQPAVTSFGDHRRLPLILSVLYDYFYPVIWLWKRLTT
jgi:hypothetical protein